MGVAGSVTVVCAFSFLGGAANGVEAFAVLTAVQEQTDDAHQARINGLFGALAAGTTGAGFLLGGLTAAPPRRAPSTSSRRSASPLQRPL